MRYPFPAVPDGWFFLCQSADLRPGELKSGTWFGRELVLWRTASGEAVVADAFCPHMGAHFGKGGEVVGEHLRCPFHGFCFEASGACVSTPYADSKPPPKARLRTWPVHETHGLVLVYHHASGDAPTWRVPTVDVDGWMPLKMHAWDVRAHPQETTENSVDVGHFAEVHGYTDFTVLKPAQTDGHYLNARYGAKRLTPLVGNRYFEFEVHVFGLGYSYVEVLVPQGNLLTRQFVLPTPLEGEHTRLSVGMMVHPLDNPGALARPLALLGRRLASAVVRHFSMKTYVSDVEDDFHIWQNKAYVHPPPLAKGDGPITLYRRWARQFYSEAPGG